MLGLINQWRFLLQDEKTGIGQGTEGILWTEPAQTGHLLLREPRLVSHLRPMQTQDALPNYVDMRKPQPDLLEVRDEHSLFRQSLFRGNWYRNHGSWYDSDCVLWLFCGKRTWNHIQTHRRIKFFHVFFIIELTDAASVCYTPGINIIEAKE